MMRRHVLNPRDSPSPCRRKLGWGNDLSLLGLSTSGPRPEWCAGIHGVVSISSATISPRCLDLYRDTTNHWPNAVVTAKSQCDAASRMAWDCDYEAVAGRPVTLPDLAA